MTKEPKLVTEVKFKNDESSESKAEQDIKKGQAKNNLYTTVATDTGSLPSSGVHNSLPTIGLVLASILMIAAISIRKGGISG